MKARSYRRVRLGAVPALLLLVLSLLALGASSGNAASKHAPRATATASCGPDVGIVPNNKIGVQLWNFASYIGFGSDAATQARLEETLRRISEMGIRNVEPFSLHGLTPQQFRRLLTRYHLQAPARHGDVSITNFDRTLRESRQLGQKFIGSGGFPTPGVFPTPGAQNQNASGYENTLATAIVMNELGRRSVRNATGKFYGHNHEREFEQTYTDPNTGEVKSAWQILVENTDPRYVTFELDVAWAYDGGADPAALIRRYRDRISMLHVKDAINTRRADVRATPVPAGQGEVPLAEILRTARQEGRIAYYFLEQDPPFDNPSFDPFAALQQSYDYVDCLTAAGSARS